MSARCDCHHKRANLYVVAVSQKSVESCVPFAMELLLIQTDSQNHHFVIPIHGYGSVKRFCKSLRKKSKLFI